MAPQLRTVYTASIRSASVPPRKTKAGIEGWGRRSNLLGWTQRSDWCRSRLPRDRRVPVAYPGRIQHRSRRREVSRKRTCRRCERCRSAAFAYPGRSPEGQRRDVRGTTPYPLGRLAPTVSNVQRTRPHYRTVDRRCEETAVFATVIDRLQADETLGNVGHTHEVFAAARRDMRMDGVSVYLRQRLRLHSEEE